MRSWSLLLLLLAACKGDNGPACEAAEVACVDAMILDLALQNDKTSDAAVTTETDGADFVTAIDASAGGTQGASSSPWAGSILEDGSTTATSSPFD